MLNRIEIKLERIKWNGFTGCINYDDSFVSLGQRGKCQSQRNVFSRRLDVNCADFSKILNSLIRYRVIPVSSNSKLNASSTAPRS